MPEWSFIGHSRRIPFNVLPRLSNELPRRLCLLPLPDLPTLGQRQQFLHPITPASSSEADIPTHGDARVLVRDSSAESGLCRVRNLGTKMGPQMHASHSDTVQSAQACANSGVPDSIRIAGAPSAHDRIAEHILSPLRLHVPFGTYHADLWG